MTDKTDSFRSGLVHDLRHPMQVLSVRLPAIEASWKAVVDGSVATADSPLAEHAREALAAFRQVALMQDALLRQFGFEQTSDVSLNPAIRRFGLLSMLEPAVAIAEHARADRHIRIELPSEDVTLQTNASTLHRIVTNLVLNAIQHSHGSYVRIEANADSVNLVLRVADDGRGLPGTRVHGVEGYLRYPSARATAPGQSGTGLRASIELAESLGGLLELQSSTKSGTVWCLTVPDVIVRDEKPQRDFTDDELSGQTIVVLDDQKLGAEAVGQKFAALGASVITVYNEMDLLRRIQRAFPRPVLYVLDFLLSHGTTLSRSLDMLANIPGALQSSVVLTAHPRHHALTTVRERVAGVLPRPLQDSHFRALVDFASGRTRPLHMALSKLTPVALGPSALRN